MNDILCLYNIVWTSKETYSTAFDNVEENSTLSISTYRVNERDMEIFINGYEELKKRIKPSKILIYGKLLDSLIDDYKNGLICYIPPRWKLIKDRNF